MKAMILAAGRGERMRPLTDHLPKPLLAAGGKPLIVWHIERLARAGIRDIVINHAWLGAKLEAALGDGAALGVQIAYSAEGSALETAGGIARALPLLAAPLPREPLPREPLPREPLPREPLPGASLTGAARADEPFLVVSGDTWCDFDYGRARTIALQMRAARLACWLVMVPNPPHHAGGDFALESGLVRLAHRRYTYAGIGLYMPWMFAQIEPGARSPLRPWLEREIAAGRAAGEYHDGLWFDIGTAQRLAELDLLLADRTTHAGA
jgi:N-acetyl-alpha-D-muramate 1-phosphate uridylyltransferase